MGGHTCEGIELSLGFAVNGVQWDSDDSSSSKKGKSKKSKSKKGSKGGNAVSSEIVRKGGMEAGHALVLTKPIGTQLAVGSLDGVARVLDVKIGDEFDVKTGDEVQTWKDLGGVWRVEWSRSGV